MHLTSPVEPAPLGDRRRKRSRIGSALLCVLLPFACGACVFNADHRCSANQEYQVQGMAEVCVCDARSYWTAKGCIPCNGDHEVPGVSGCLCAAGYGRSPATGICTACAADEIAGPNGCECKAGYGHATAAAVCTEIVSGQGALCNAQKPCADPVYSYCDVKAGTGTCAAPPTDAGSGGATAPKTTTSNIGTTCTSDADCAGGDATYCDTFQNNNKCLIKDCNLAQDNCPTGYACCNLPALAPIFPVLCVAQGACPL